MQENTNYTTIFPEFIYRRSYKQPMNRAGDTITLLEEERNSVNIKLTILPLEGSDASYVGMAKHIVTILLPLVSLASKIRMKPAFL